MATITTPLDPSKISKGTWGNIAWSGDSEWDTDWVDYDGPNIDINGNISLFLK